MLVLPPTFAFHPHAYHMQDANEALVRFKSDRIDGTAILIV